MRARSVAIMQPYFAPYEGYFRLFSVADTLVFLDDVQFPRSGFVHRNRLPDVNYNSKWLTLPIARCDRSTLIHELQFQEDARHRLSERIRCFPQLFGNNEYCRRYIWEPFEGSDGPCSMIIQHLSRIVEDLGLSCRLVRSTDIMKPENAGGVERLLAILDELRAREYINPPGGHKLYSRGTFAARGVRLRVLRPYKGTHWSILETMRKDSFSVIRDRLDRSAFFYEE